MKKCFTLAAALATMFLASQAQAATNFTGVWKLNLSKSDFGPVPQPDVMTRTINHNDPSLQISTYTKGRRWRNDRGNKVYDRRQTG